MSAEIELAKQHGIAYYLTPANTTEMHGTDRQIQAFAEAVRAAERERCAVTAWTHYMDTCQRNGRAPSMWHEWCAADVIRRA